MAALRTAVHAILENRSFADTARVVLDSCRMILGAEGGLVGVCGGPSGEVEVVLAAGLPDGAGKGELPAPLRAPAARAAKGGAILANSFSTKGVPGSPGRAPIRTALLAPIMLDGERAGLLGLVNKPGGFSAGDAELGELFAEMLAMSILGGRVRDRFETKRTVLEDQVRDAVSELRKAYESEQQARQRLQSLSRRLVDAQESERRSISRELHDEAGQALASLRFGLRLLERKINEGGSVTDQVADLVQQTDAVIDGLHRLAVDLRPVSLDHLGLEAALRQYARSAGAKFGLAVRFKARGLKSERLPPEVETALYRVVQEAMTNVVRHAGATRVDVILEKRDDRVVVIVEDDGAGFEQGSVSHGEHFGLLGMRERAEALGGTLTLESSPGAGTTVVVEVSSADPNPDR